jgi:hypothetical protein
MMEAASTSETSVNFYNTTLRNSPEDSHLKEISLSKHNRRHSFIHVASAIQICNKTLRQKFF